MQYSSVGVLLIEIIVTVYIVVSVSIVDTTLLEPVVMVSIITNLQNNYN